MTLNRTPMTVLLLLAVLAAVQMVHYHPLLPDNIAVHFGAGGEPNGWSNKTEFVLTYGGTEAFIMIVGVALAFVLGRIPASLINIPHREYWLSPERKDETLVFLVDQLLWIEVATLAFLIAIAQLVFKENLGEVPPRLSGEFWYVLVAFVGATLWMTARIILRFRRSD